MKPAPAVIRIFGSRALRRAAEPLAAGAPQTRVLLDSLWATLCQGSGVGLAAPQIGSPHRAFVIRDPERPADTGRIDLVNPVLQETFGPLEVFEEGCLSFPGMYFNVRRPRGAVIRYQDAEGRERALEDEGLLARIALHELDHLDGVLFIDRISGWRRAWLAPRLLWVALVGWLTGKRNG